MKLGEAFFSGGEGRFFFAEGEADLIGAVARLEHLASVRTLMDMLRRG